MKKRERRKIVGKVKLLVLNARYLSVGNDRAPSALHHALNNMLDITEIRSDLKLGKIMELGSGEEIKQLLDQRPHPNSREFLEDLNRDIACGLGNISSDVLWNIAKLGGASVRYVLDWLDANPDSGTGAESSVVHVDLSRTRIES